MKLQVNQKGSWRNVVEFEDSREKFIAVAEAARPLARALGTSATWRIVDAADTVLGYCESTDFEWRLKGGSIRGTR